MNTTELISALKIQGSFPTSNDLFSDSDFLVLFNMCMTVDITSLMARLNDEYCLETLDFEITPGATYRLPRRIVTIRDLKFVDSSGNESDLDRNFEEDRSSNRAGYYIVRNSIELSDNFSSGTLRMKYFARPSKLVLPTDCGQIQAIDRTALTIEVGTAPATFANNTLVDLVQNQNPYDLLALDRPIVNISGTTVTLSTIPADLEIGDWLTIANTSPVPQAPEEMHVLLVQAALVKSLSAKKDKAAKEEAEKLQMMTDQVITMLEPRVNNSSVKMRSGKVFHYFSNGRY